MSLPQPRIRRNRVKTGCGTCRIRKVKCGEERPACSRCTSTGRTCDGYTVLLRTTRESQRRLEPRSAQQQRTELSVPIHCLSRLSKEELDGFSFFRDLTVKAISGCFSSSLWDQRVFQLCHCEPTVIHAVIAVGSMHHSLSENARVPSKALVTRQRCMFAIAQYLKSLGALRARLEEAPGPESAELALVVCILFVCLEMLQGNNRGVVTHLETGLRILRTQVPQDGLVPRKNAHASCVNELSAVFARLDLDTIPFGERSVDGSIISPYFSLVPANEFDGWMKLIPRSFINLADARSYLDALTNAVYHFSSELVNACQPCGDLSTDFAVRRCYQSSASRQLSLSKTLKMRGDALKNGLSRWSSAYRTLITSPKQATGSRAQAILETRLITLRFQILTAFDQHELPCDQFNASFRRIVRFAEHIIASTSETLPEFAMESAIIPSLYLTALKCREPGTRWKAIALLKNSSYREGTWDSHLVGVFAEQVATLEEGASRTPAPLTSADIPEAARFNTVIVAGSTKTTGYGRLVCGRFHHETDGELRISEMEFPIVPAVP